MNTNQPTNLDPNSSEVRFGTLRMSATLIGALIHQRKRSEGSYGYTPFSKVDDILHLTKQLQDGGVAGSHAEGCHLFLRQRAWEIHRSTSTMNYCCVKSKQKIKGLISRLVD